MRFNTDTVLWTGKHYALKKSPSSTDCHRGEKTFYPSEVYLETLQLAINPHGYTCTLKVHLHECTTAPSPRFRGKDVTTGRWCKRVETDCLKRALAADEAFPAEQAERRAKRLAEQTASDERERSEQKAKDRRRDAKARALALANRLKDFSQGKSIPGYPSYSSFKAQDDGADLARLVLELWGDPQEAGLGLHPAFDGPEG